MIQKSLILFLYLCSFCSLSFAQGPIQTREYPKGYFRYPLDLPPSTAGSFGELRPNHFHAGLDFRTNQQSGYPVHAAADGYVSRLRVQFGGGGNVVYIDHPNGYTTVYMHLSHFNAELTKLLRDQQYKQQIFDVDFKLPPQQVKVSRGEVIALSGSTGAVAGPHLHFEIRDTKSEETINPQLFGITIPDVIPPTIYSIGIYHIDNQPFNEKTRHGFLAVAGKGGSYHLVKPGAINLSGQIGFGISTNDMNSASVNHNGVYSIELKLDGKTVYTFAAERFAFDQTHAINAYIDYPSLLTTRRWMQKCFMMPGGKISLYPQNINRGLINFNDDALHDVEYVVKDVMGNVATVNLKVQSQLAKSPAVSPSPAGTLFHYNQANIFENNSVRVRISPGNLYDDLDFIYAASAMPPGAYSMVHHIHNRLTPVHDSYDLWIKPDKDLGHFADKAVIVNTDGDCELSNYQDGYVKTQPKGFGNYYIKLDTVPPHITPVNIASGKNMEKMHTISLKIGDNLSGIKSYNGKIDGKWVLMEWDFKTKVLSYTFDSELPHGKHNFELTVSDNKDNIAIYKAEFYR